jgi:hypothetical protein
MSVQTNIISVLIDLSVLRRAVMTDRVEIERKIIWGNITHAVPLLGWRRKPELRAEQAWLKSQVDWLPTIARLAREDRLKLYSYNELGLEEARGRRGMKGTFGDLFADVRVQTVPPAIERSRYRKTYDLETYSNKNSLTEFVLFLNGLDTSNITKIPDFWNSLPDFERQNLGRLTQFTTLCQTIAENHYADAFHLWTAELNCIDFFLMMDKRFLNAFRSQSRSSFRCSPVTPEELIQQVGITELDPMPPIPEGGPHGYF